VLLDGRDERGPAVESVEELAVEPGDLVPQACQLRFDDVKSA